MAADFIQPAGGLVENGDPMIYQFSGDDDVLVYIDGMLVMDLGGPHTRAGGSIDFSTGLVETYLSGDPINGILSHKEFLSKYLDECTETDDGLYTYKSKEVKYYSTTIYECFKFAMEEAGLSVSEIEAKLSEYFVSGGSKITDVAGKEYPVYRLKDNTQHTFDWFYLERYEGQANFNVYFNLLTIPLSTVTVEKQVSGNMGDRNREFDFTIALDKVRDTKGNVPNEVQYVVTDISTGTSTSNTINITKNSNNNDDGGKGEWSGTLKHNQKIQFLNLAIDTTYTIMETEVVGYETTVNGDKKSVVEGSITGGGTSYFLFTNTKEANIDTAAHFDTIPYILTLAFVIPAGVFFFRKRRRTA